MRVLISDFHVSFWILRLEFPDCIDCYRVHGRPYDMYMMTTHDCYHLSFWSKRAPEMRQDAAQIYKSLKTAEQHLDARLARALATVRESVMDSSEFYGQLLWSIQSHFDITRNRNPERVPIYDDVLAQLLRDLQGNPRRKKILNPLPEVISNELNAFIGFIGKREF